MKDSAKAFGDRLKMNQMRGANTGGCVRTFNVMKNSSIQKNQVQTETVTGELFHTATGLAFAVLRNQAHLTTVW